MYSKELLNNREKICDGTHVENSDEVTFTTNLTLTETLSFQVCSNIRSYLKPVRCWITVELDTDGKVRAALRHIFSL